MTFDSTLQRQIMGRFATGVTLVTTRRKDGEILGMTIALMSIIICSTCSLHPLQPVVSQTLMMVVVIIFVFTNFVVDILYAWLDPRIRYA